jgi:hypothetical protein
MTRINYEPARDNRKMLRNEFRNNPVNPGNPKDKGKNRKSYCICCCPSPVTLYGHVQCDHDPAECEDVCIGTESGSPGVGPLTLSENVQNNCIDWDVIDSPSAFLQCSGGISVPPVEFDVDMALHCQRQNKFRLDLCFGSPASVDPYDCNQGGYLSLEPITEVSCSNWDPDEENFVLDFGYFQPVGCGNLCGFRVFINQDSSGSSSPPMLAFIPSPGIHDFFA